MKQTAVEWLEKICNDRGYHLMSEYIKQAKEMEKEQKIIILTKYHNSLFVLPLKGGEAESIYNHIVGVNKMITKQRKEIQDFKMKMRIKHILMLEEEQKKQERDTDTPCKTYKND